MNIDQVIAAFLDHRRGRRCSLRTIEQYRYQLEDLWLTWRRRQQLPDDLALISPDEIIAYFRYLLQEHINQHTGKIGLAPATAASGWRVIRALWNFAARRKWLAIDQLDFFKDDELIPRPAVDERMQRMIEDDTVLALLAACGDADDPEERALNFAIVRLLADTGARASELAGLKLEDLDMKERRAKVIGKGNREEWIFWGYRTSIALRAYLLARGPAEGTLFRSVSKQNRGAPLSTNAMRLLMKRLAKKAETKLPPGAPLHGFRVRFGHKGLDSGLDSSQVGQLMRHRHHSTTLRYLRENAKRLQKLHGRIEDLNP
jgi:site-specific recombinase XerD